MKKYFKYFFLSITFCFTMLIPFSVYADNVGDTYKCTYYINVAQNGSTKKVNLLNVYWKFTEFNKYETYTPENGSSYESLENDFFKVTTATSILKTSDKLCPDYCVLEHPQGTLNFQTNNKQNLVNCLPDGTINFEKTVIKLVTNNSTNNKNDDDDNSSKSDVTDIENAFIGTTSCGGIKNFQFPNALPNITSFAYNLLKIAIPVILIIKGSLDMFKAVSSQKEDEMKKAQKKFTQRLIAGFLAFFVLMIVETVINFIADKTGNNNAMDCVNCFIKGSNYCTKN